ncbi:MAG: MFS transporter [Deltaproteobacteria bacterium]|nr:MFS transporter [Deltaproteobacteria bacterium]MBW2120575.1 MFS transporter [Deltaproteobacteria bacterium]
MKGERGRAVWSWCMYDWANSAFATTIMAAVLPAYYSSVAGVGLGRTTASSYWGYTNTIAMFTVAVLAPILGAMADHGGARKKYLATFASLGILSTGLMVLIGTGDWLMASLLYIFGRIGFAGGNIFYDALLPHVADEDRIDQVSAYGYAFGYLGGGLLLLLNLLAIMKPALFGLPGAAWGSRLSFLSVALWWALFSIPLFKNVGEPPARRIEGESDSPLRAGFQRLASTLREIRRFREAFKFLIAFWLYNDGIGTIIVMAVIFGAEVNIGQSTLIGAILAVQFIGFPCSILYGLLARRLGAKNSILLGLVVYTGIAIGGYFLKTALHFWILAFLVGTVQGGTQALSRSLFGSMIPRFRTAEFFGFYDVSSKFAGILGPLIFGIVGQITGTSRLSVVSLIVFFIGGGLLLLKVRPEEGARMARQTEA